MKKIIVILILTTSFSFSQNSDKIIFSETDIVPIYPGCNKGDNEAKRKCMSKKIAKHIKKNFDKTVVKKLGLSGLQKIAVIFKIDKTGNVFAVRSKASHQNLEKEAIRVIKMLPILKPGIYKGEKVIVPYSLPIMISAD